MIINNELECRHLYLVGRSGAGKSTAAKREIDKAKRVIVFDQKNEYHDGFIQTKSIRELIAVLKSAPCVTPCKVAYKGTSKKEFQDWCACVLAWGSCVAIAEEIATVTSSGKASEHWLRLVSQGRAIGQDGIMIIATSQRPQEADKTILGNAARIRTGLLRPADRLVVAREMDIDVSLLDPLKPLDWVEYKSADHSVIGGNYKYPNKKVITLKEAI